MSNRVTSRNLVTEQGDLAPGFNRREEVRIEDCEACGYDIIGSGEPRVAAAPEGQAFTLNRSVHGALLLMGQAPQPSQLIEVHSARLGWWRSITQYDVRWTRPIQIGPQGSLFLVGCRVTAGLPL